MKITVVSIVKNNVRLWDKKKTNYDTKLWDINPYNACWRPKEKKDYEKNTMRERVLEHQSQPRHESLFVEHNYTYTYKNGLDRSNTHKYINFVKIIWCGMFRYIKIIWYRFG